MDIRRAQISIRARTSWEAIDLGFAMAREWFPQLWRAWLMLALPVWLLAHLLFHDRLWLAALLVWWFKPLYEQPLLYIASRRLFGETVAPGELRQRLSIILWPQWLASISWRRLNLSRSFDNPVAMLEGQTGKARTQRLRLLHRQQSVSSWLTVIGAHIEGILNLSLMLLIALLIPDQLDWLEAGDFLLHHGANQPLANWLSNAGYLLALSIVAPFYVCAGFSLYIHTRIRLEAWEIEIAFRAIRQRLDGLKSKLAGYLLPACLALLVLTAPTDGLAWQAGIDQSPAASRQLISEVLTDEDFGATRSETRWRLRPSAETGDQGSRWLDWWYDFLRWLFGTGGEAGDVAGIGLAHFIEILLWLAAITAIALALWHLAPYLRWPTMPRGRGRPDDMSSTLAIKPLVERLELNELPDDILRETERLRDQQNIRGAISLLYRGALRCLIDQARLDIPASATEQDCLALVNQHRTPDESRYFADLTRSWQELAYAHRPPDDPAIDALTSAWPRYYGGRA